MATKLHEVLAVEGSLENQMNKCLADLKNTFEKKTHLFAEKRVIFQPNAEGQPEVDESPANKIESTVRGELVWIAGHINKSLDASYTVACTNTVAMSDIVMEGGTVLVPDVPATALLELEKRIAAIVDLLKAIPTLDPARGFKLDSSKGSGIYVASEIVKTRTKKTKEVMKLAAATKEHAEQVLVIDVDAPIGKIREVEWSSLITPAEKAALIDRAEQVGRAVRQARSRANAAEAQPHRIGSLLTDYILASK